MNRPLGSRPTANKHRLRNRANQSTQSHKRKRAIGLPPNGHQNKENEAERTGNSRNPLTPLLNQITRTEPSTRRGKELAEKENNDGSNQRLRRTKAKCYFGPKTSRNANLRSASRQPLEVPNCNADAEEIEELLREIDRTRRGDTHLQGDPTSPKSVRGTPLPDRDTSLVQSTQATHQRRTTCRHKVKCRFGPLKGRVQAHSRHDGKVGNGSQQHHEIEPYSDVPRCTHHDKPLPLQVQYEETPSEFQTRANLPARARTNLLGPLIQTPLAKKRLAHPGSP
jgi:hypothetical protein